MAETPRELIAATLQLVDKALGVARELEGSGLETTLASIHSKLTELREAVLTLGEENLALSEKLRKVDASLVKGDELVRHRGVYWVRNDPDPWCPVCWERDHVALHLARTDLLAGRLCQCPQCGYNANLDNTYPPRDWQDD